METKTASNFWWMKSANKPVIKEDSAQPTSVPRLELDISSSLADFLEKEQNALSSNKDDYTDVDVGSIIEEINRVAAQSPLGPFNTSSHERSIDDIMKEAEKVYMESSKSFEQLSQRSKTSQNISDILSSGNDSTPTPKSLSPLPLDPQQSDSESESYSEDFSEASKIESIPSPGDDKIIKNNVDNVPTIKASPLKSSSKSGNNSYSDTLNKSTKASIIAAQNVAINDPLVFENNNIIDEKSTKESDEMVKVRDEVNTKNGIIKTLEDDNKQLRTDIRQIKLDLQETKQLLESTKIALSAKTITSPEINLELEKALEDLKDSKEINTALQLQIDGLNKTHQILKNSYDDVTNSNRNLERRVVELDATLNKYKTELLNIQKSKDRSFENEQQLNKLLEAEKQQSKNMKLQNEKDAKCIQDLNRQIKEMERIIARKHPDSVSALIVAAKKDETDTNLTARKLLEDRIKALEQEAELRDTQSSKVFVEIQEKFNQMKLKYENHIEDLELHVSDLKTQLKRKTDTYDVYTQTFLEEQKIPEKESHSVLVQTDPLPVKPPKIVAVKRNEKVAEVKTETHLIATIRGLQTDLSNKEKVVNKLQKDLDELRKTNRRLQKEREGSLKSLNDKREFRSYPEKLALQVRTDKDTENCLEEELKLVKNQERKLKEQLCQLEEDYQKLKSKRIYDLSTLQEAHEREISNIASNVTPMREQLELQQVTISTLQSQLGSTKEELAIVTVERDHLNSRLLNLSCKRNCVTNNSNEEVEELKSKIAFLETRYEEREHRLRAIVHGLAQKNVSNRSCEQCADRQQQLIGYKNELDQLLATLRALK